MNNYSRLKKCARFYWLAVEVITVGKKQKITTSLKRKIAIKEQIALIYFESKQRYGSPRITLELQSLGYKISRPERSKLAKQYIEIWYNRKEDILL